MGQAPVVSFMKPLYDKNVANEFDPKAINTYKLSLNEAKHGYKIFNDHEDACIKAVLKPYMKPPPMERTFLDRLRYELNQ